MVTSFTLLIPEWVLPNRMILTVGEMPSFSTGYVERSAALQVGWNKCVQQSYFQQAEKKFWSHCVAYQLIQWRNAKTAEDRRVAHLEGTAVRSKKLALLFMFHWSLVVVNRLYQFWDLFEETQSGCTPDRKAVNLVDMGQIARKRSCQIWVSMTVYIETRCMMVHDATDKPDVL